MTTVDGETTSGEIDWDQLRTAATDAAQNAGAHYSGLKVGAAGLANDGQIYSGCNVESASYGLTLCAECGLISAMQLAGADKLIALAACDEHGGHLMPCGRCRQLLYEAGGADLLIDHPEAPIRGNELLPHAFTSDDLPNI